MANGAAALAVLPLDPSITSACAEVDTRNAVEIAIGEVTAAATVMVCTGLEEWAAGGLTGATRIHAGDLFVKLYQLQEEAALRAIDFDGTARGEGKKTLLQRHGATIRTHLNLTELALDGALDELIERPLTVLRRVTACERAWAH
jgi:hypothetical protein